MQHPSRSTHDWPENPQSDAPTPQLTVLLPTRNEVGNVGPLLGRLQAVCRDRAVEVIFVDDSDDDTSAEAERLGAACRFPVLVIHRAEGQRDGGLSGAVVRGMRAARAPWIVVMDADLQHPPEVIERLLERADAGDVDLVAASRFHPESDRPAGLGRLRTLVSHTLIGAARLALPKQLRGATDPLTGFFLVRRDSVDLDVLEPRGFKILLEIIGRTPGIRFAEIGFDFAARQTGTSKASARQVWQYFAQLINIRSDKLLRRIGRFGLVGISGLGVNTLAFWILLSAFSHHYVVAALLATQVSTAWNFLWTDRWVFRGREFRRTAATRVLSFFSMNNAALLLRVPILIGLVSGLQMNEVAGNLVSLVAITALRFVVSDGWIWAQGAVGRALYDIHGIISVASDARLPELERFRVDQLAGPATIDVRLGRVRRGTPAERSGADPDTVVYREWTGNLGFAARISCVGRRREIIASRGLRMSPHVLYTNVVEPVLRWLFVEYDYALVHAACIGHDGEGFLITARTDTGKTTTILKTLDNLPWSFLSDDLVLLAPDGRLLTYPKPLTISLHTVHAVRSPLLSRFERVALPLQSRLHSKSGRRIGFLLVRGGIPTATLNAIVQGLIPPPKYHVDRLVPGVRMAETARFSGLVVIERGGTGSVSLTPGEARETLLANCDDAYGFPPYETIAPFLQQRAGRDLRSHERSIIAQALSVVPATLVRSETMDWWQRLPGVLEDFAERGPAGRGLAGASGGQTSVQSA